LVLAAVPVALFLMGLLLRSHITPRILGAVVVGEVVALAVVVPCFAAAPRAALRWLLPVLWILAFPLGLSSGREMAAQPFLLAWAALLAGVAALSRSLGASRSTSQLLTLLLAFAMIGTPFYANWLVETAPTPALRKGVVDVALWTNPWLTASGSILQSDPIRTKQLYEFSTIHLYGFRYPGTGITPPALRALVLICCYGAVAGLLHGSALLLRRRRTKE